VRHEKQRTTTKSSSGLKGQRWTLSCTEPAGRRCL